MTDINETEESVIISKAIEYLEAEKTYIFKILIKSMAHKEFLYFTTSLNIVLDAAREGVVQEGSDGLG